MSARPPRSPQPQGSRAHIQQANQPTRQPSLRQRQRQQRAGSRNKPAKNTKKPKKHPKSKLAPPPSSTPTSRPARSNQPIETYPSPPPLAKILLVPLLSLLSLITTITLLRLLRTQANVSHILAVPALKWFLIGSITILASITIPPLRRPLSWLYVLGHEASHALAVILHGGRIYGFHVSSHSGHILTNRSNTIITLAPYLLPIWSAWWILLLVPLNHYLPLAHFQPVLCAGLGSTMTFHLIYTLRMSTVDQSDFLPNGLAFSLLLILTVNSLLLLILLVLGSPQFSLQGSARIWLDSAQLLLQLAHELIAPGSTQPS